MNVPCILPAKKRAPPAKADCVSASGKTRPFCAYGAGGFEWCSSGVGRQPELGGATLRLGRD